MQNKRGQNSVSCDPLICTFKKKYIGKCVETVYHNQCSEMNGCEIKYSHALSNALNIHGKCTGVKMHNTKQL